MIRILVFGDSITYGSWDTQGGWVDRLKQKAHEITVQSEGTTKIQIMNLGIGGDTSRKILARIRNEIEARTAKAWDLKIVLSFGVNDERSRDGIVEVPLEEYRLNAQSIVNEAIKYTNDILVVGNPPLGQNSVNFKIFEYSDDRLRQYDELLKTVAEESNLIFVPIRTAFEATGIDGLFVYDNIHVSDKGHSLIESIVKPYVFK